MAEKTTVEIAAIITNHLGLKIDANRTQSVPWDRKCSHSALPVVLLVRVLRESISAVQLIPAAKGQVGVTDVITSLQYREHGYG